MDVCKHCGGDITHAIGIPAGRVVGSWVHAEMPGDGWAGHKGEPEGWSEVDYAKGWGDRG